MNLSLQYVETLNGVARPSYHLGGAWQLML
ncbi:MAG: hypothetical protein QOG46_2191, partial [Pseudonocardiales bacterium]|nr:hypothetical protein [Pseudonocardiales bacterium]